jgi:hypothetical protein
MKKPMLILTVLFFAHASYSQIFSWGLKGGLNSTKLKFDDFSASIDEANPDGSKVGFSPADSKMGYHIGAFTRIKLLALYVQPELYFSSTSAQIDINDAANSVKTVAKVKYNQLNIPVLAGMKFGPARFNLGPVATMNFSSKAEVDKAYKGAVEDYTTVNKAVTWGGQVGAGIDILGKLTFDLRYEFGLSKLGDSITVGDQEFGTDQRQNQFLASVGFMF